ncbi:eukaryotic translation initiation factor 1 [Earliella scabrosa]|nr:eukaryotic translation initiation factor 1 [Earliella scabrosa]
MSVQNLNTFDPFADEGDPLGSTQDVGSQSNYIHIRIQQRNGRKTLTTLQGLPKEYDLKKLLKAFKKVSPWLRFYALRAHGSALEGGARLTIHHCQEFACNGTLVDDEEAGQVIQLQGDQRLKISQFLVQEGISKNTIKVHGF